MSVKKYYSLETNERTATVYIYGDITSWPWLESDVSSYLLSRQIEGLDVDNINVYINSYGGEVAEGLAIYNNLKRHKAKVTTYCDGFACSAASVIFMAGDERIMYPASLLMIHNAWSIASGDSDDLRKAADDLETMTSVAKESYLSAVNISESKLNQLLDAETWLSPADSLEMGFSTKTADYKQSDPYSMQSKKIAFAKMRSAAMDRAKITDFDNSAVLEAISNIDKKIDAMNSQPQKPKSIFKF